MLSPGSRFDGFTRLESHADSASTSGTCLAARSSLYALCAFRDRAGSRFRYEPTPHLPGCDASGTSPDCAAFVNGARHFFTTRRLATTRSNIMASDVGRGLRAAACRQREGPVRAHSSREWNVTGSPPRGRPRTPYVIDPGACTAGVPNTAWRDYPLADQDSRCAPPPAKEEALPRTRVLRSAS